MIVGFIDKDMGVKVYDITGGVDHLKKMEIGEVKVLHRLSGNMLMGADENNPRDYSSIERVEIWLEYLGHDEEGYHHAYRRIEI